MPFCPYFAVFFFYSSIFVDYEGCPFGSHECSSVKFLLLPYAITIQNFCFWVAQQGEGQLMLLFESLMGFDAIFAHTQNNDAFLFEILSQISEFDSFLCASGSAILRIEIQNHLLSSVIAQGNVFLIVG